MPGVPIVAWNPVAIAVDTSREMFEARTDIAGFRTRSLKSSSDRVSSEAKNCTGTFFCVATTSAVIVSVVSAPVPPTADVMSRPVLTV